METFTNFEVDGILFEFSEPLVVGHTGSAPYCYDGEVVVEGSGTTQLVATRGDYIVQEILKPETTKLDMETKIIPAIKKSFERAGAI